MTGNIFQKPEYVLGIKLLLRDRSIKGIIHGLNVVWFPFTIDDVGLLFELYLRLGELAMRTALFATCCRVRLGKLYDTRKYFVVNLPVVLYTHISAAVAYYSEKFEQMGNQKGVDGGKGEFYVPFVSRTSLKRESL